MLRRVGEFGSVRLCRSQPLFVLSAAIYVQLYVCIYAASVLYSFGFFSFISSWPCAAFTCFLRREALDPTRRSERWRCRPGSDLEGKSAGVTKLISEDKKK